MSSDEASPLALGFNAKNEKIGKKKKGCDGATWIVYKPGPMKSKEWRRIKIDCSRYVRYVNTMSKKNIIDDIYGLSVGKDHIFKDRYWDLRYIEKKKTKIPKGYKKVTVPKNMMDDCKNRHELYKDNDAYKKLCKKYDRYYIYFIHDNGGRPFVVYIKNKQVDVYKVAENHRPYGWEISKIDKRNAWMYTKSVMKCCALRVFVGKSPRNEFTEHWGSYGKQFDGNSILIHVSNNMYIYIGGYICKFRAKTKIVKFIGLMGNNDVPYSYAIDETGNYYMITPEGIGFMKKTDKKYRDLWDRYYKNKKNIEHIKITMIHRGRF
jgi:hypothetical protein